MNIGVKILRFQIGLGWIFKVAQYNGKKLEEREKIIITNCLKLKKTRGKKANKRDKAISSAL